MPVFKSRLGGSVPFPSLAPPPTTIDEVISKLEEVFAWARESPSRIGYFTALYIEVTIAVRNAVNDGTFANPALIEALDVAFASRYLTALEQFTSAQQPSDPGTIQLGECALWWPSVIQHLLLGANAHINLDLGVAMAQVIPAAEFPGFQPDYLKVNAILASVVPWVETRLSLIFPLLVFVNKYLANVESLIINFSLEQARQNAWDLAERLLPLGPADREPVIARAWRFASRPAFAVRPLHPGFILSAVGNLIRLTEIGTVRSTIDDLRDESRGQPQSKKRSHGQRLTMTVKERLDSRPSCSARLYLTLAWVCQAWPRVTKIRSSRRFGLPVRWAMAA